MGFGIKLVPGVKVRMSSRGVRVGVGPRWARAHVGTRGVGVSVGPRAARAYVGSGGSFVSSGVGPVQVGPRGPQLSAAVGPLKVVLGRQPTAILAAGPFWLSQTTGQAQNRAPGSRSTAGRKDEPALLGETRVQPDMEARYDDYLDALSSDGVSRRGTLDMFAAHVHTSLLDFLPIVALVERYSAPVRPDVPSIPSDAELREAATVRLLERGVSNQSASYEGLETEADFARAGRDYLKARREAYRWFHRGGRANLAAEKEALMAAASAARATWKFEVEEAARALRAEIRTEREYLIGRVEEAFQRFVELDPAINLLVMQAVFADNGGTAAPISLDGSELLVLMSFPETAKTIWPEKTATTPGGVPTVRKRTKAEKEQAYTQHVFLHTLATVKEALATQPRLSAVRIVVIREMEGVDLEDLPVLAIGSFDRDTALAALLDSTDEWDSAWMDVINEWRRGLGENFLRAWEDWGLCRGALVARAQQTLDDLHDCWEMSLNGGRLGSIGALREIMDEADLRELVGHDGMIDSANEAEVAITELPDGPALPQFWDEVLSIAEDGAAPAAEIGTTDESVIERDRIRNLDDEQPSGVPPGHMVSEELEMIRTSSGTGRGLRRHIWWVLPTVAVMVVVAWLLLPSEPDAPVAGSGSETPVSTTTQQPIPDAATDSIGLALAEANINDTPSSRDDLVLVGEILNMSFDDLVAETMTPAELEACLLGPEVVLEALVEVVLPDANPRQPAVDFVRIAADHYGNERWQDFVERCR